MQAIQAPAPVFAPPGTWVGPLGKALTATAAWRTRARPSMPMPAEAVASAAGLVMGSRMAALLSRTLATHASHGREEGRQAAFCRRS